MSSLLCFAKISIQKRKKWLILASNLKQRNKNVQFIDATFCFVHFSVRKRILKKNYAN